MWMLTMPDLDLDSLLDTTPDGVVMPKPVKPEATPVETAIVPDPVVYLDYTGSAAWVTGAPGQPLLGLRPGLNAVSDKVLSATLKHPPMAAAVESPRDAEGKPTGPALIEVLGSDFTVTTDLVERTTDPEMLKLLLAREMAKPVSAGPANRRNPEIVAALTRRVK
jgi:hypothetical protein